tara:strand:- start:238 stop:501 length:264 start_codon:yes stop_codon:yes gene_type:complete
MYKNISELTKNKLYKYLYLLPGFNYNRDISEDKLSDNIILSDSSMISDDKYRTLLDKINETKKTSNKSSKKKANKPSSKKKSKKNKN